MTRTWLHKSDSTRSRARPKKWKIFLRERFSPGIWNWIWSGVTGLSPCRSEIFYRKWRSFWKNQSKPWIWTLTQLWTEQDQVYKSLCHINAKLDKTQTNTEERNRQGLFLSKFNKRSLKAGNFSPTTTFSVLPDYKSLKIQGKGNFVISTQNTGLEQKSLCFVSCGHRHFLHSLVHIFYLSWYYTACIVFKRKTNSSMLLRHSYKNRVTQGSTKHFHHFSS